jgi:hypothetical protein
MFVMAFYLPTAKAIWNFFKKKELEPLPIKGKQ